jgi:hypothetical protein
MTKTGMVAMRMQSRVSLKRGTMEEGVEDEVEHWRINVVLVETTRSNEESNHGTVIICKLLIALTI